MKNIGLSARCPFCGSKNTAREEVEAYDEGWNIIVSIYNKCRNCNEKFIEEVAYEAPSKYTVIPVDEVEE